MTELYPDPADRHHIERDERAALTDRTVPNLEEPNYATTDVDPTPGSPRHDEVQDASGLVAAHGVAHPAVDPVRPDTGSSRGR